MQLMPPPRIHQALEGFCGATNRIQVSRAVSEIPQQGFRLRIQPDGVQIEVADDAGLFYARQTLQQWIDQHSESQLPCCRIVDWPDYEQRGYMLDISRDRVPTMAHLYELVDTLASLRYNQLQLYTEHTFAYQRHEPVWRNASPLTAAEVRQLDTYCRERSIELVPNQNSFGHMERWLCHHDYKQLAECPEGFQHPISGEWRPQGSVLKPDAQSLAFVDGLYRELLPNFSSAKFNIGGDEPWELGEGASRERIKAEGKHAVYLDFLSRVCCLAESFGRAPMCWADVLLEDPESIEQLPESVTPVLWGYEADHPFEQQCARLAQLKRPFLIAPGDSTWSSYTGRHANMLANVEAAAITGQRYGAVGLLMTHWGDGGHPQTWPVSLPGMIWAGLLAWNRNAQRSELYDWLNQFLGESLTKILIESADIDQILGLKLFNRSFLMHTMSLDVAALNNFRPQPDALALRTVIEHCDAWLEDIEPALADEHIQRLASEISLSIRMNRFAAYRCLDDLRNCPDSAPEIVQDYRVLWLRRSRPGGLEESVKRMPGLRV